MAETLVQPSTTETLLQAILRAFPSLLFIVDYDGTIRDYRAGEPSMLYAPPDAFLNRKVHDVLPEEAAGRIAGLIEAVKRTGQPASIEYSLPPWDKAGTGSGRDVRWFEARLAPFASDQLIAAVQEITARKESEARIKNQLERLAALRSIDMAITSSLDLNLTLSMLLAQVVNLLRVDAAAILLLEAHSQMLEFVAGIGFHTPALQHTRLRVGDGYAGLAARERRLIRVPNIQDRRTDFLRSPAFGQENFVCYFGVPLLSKGQVRGVLEIFHRAPLNPDSEWLDFMQTLAGQAAIAIDSAMMFKDLQRSNVELTMAYDATIEGWSRALDLRDHDTEGHTQRVTEFTVRLARLAGIAEADLVHVRRGAILHDIGKIAIPDHILHKPGPLTEEEWAIMHQHPRYAYEMLAPVAFIRPALDIPRSHHEKWDGSGYPNGLKEERIPLAARLFAVVDVYDALTSDRPYRQAWPHDRVLEHLRAETGRHFDPRVAALFIGMVGNEREA